MKLTDDQLIELSLRFVVGKFDGLLKLVEQLMQEAYEAGQRQHSAYSDAVAEHEKGSEGL